jgi:quinoprotein glucose dehydrogenase
MALALLLGGCAAAPPTGHESRAVAAVSALVDGDWPTYGNDPGGTRYSPLAQIDRGNVDRLRVAWTYRTGDMADGAWASGRIAFEATPILVDGTLYLSTPFGRVIALDPETGAERWTYDPKVDRNGLFVLVTSRGVSSWLDPAAPAGLACRRSIFVGTLDARLIALDAATGSPCQDFGRGGEVNLAEGIAVGRDCRCYFVTSPPAIVNGLVTRDGKRVPAVVVGTKMGHMFVLHRETGAPLFPVEERPVPKSTVPGEEAWPTQPFPVKPRPLGTARLTPDDAWGVTLDERNACRERIRSLRYEGIFTPPSLEGTIVFPSLGGGMHWGALSHDPARGLMIAPLTHIPFVVTLVPREQYERERASMPPIVRRQHLPQRGTPYLARIELLTSPAGVFCNPPPWGTLAAVDLTSGDVRWEAPLGTVPELWARSISESRNWGSPNMGGALTTGGGLVFIGAGRDTKLRAFDVETGNVLWEAELPASAQATPMSYRSKSGKQFVVVAAGGHGVMQTKLGDHVVAFALP